uniref:Transmembrane protein n=1 Tax=Globodera pallida TaxID=36090 RepID=A0A183CJT2_GLOPA
MCLSRLGQIIYGGLALVTIALISVSMFTDGWRKLKSSDTTGVVKDFADNPTVNMGLMFCRGSTMGVNSSSSSDNEPVQQANNQQQLVDMCKQWFLNKPDWEKIVVGGMIVALALACLAFIWNLVTFCACCCHSHVMKPLPGLAGLTGLFLAVALAVFYIKNQQYIPMMKEKQFDSTGEFRKFIDKLETDGNHVGHSFYMGCGAAVVAFANSVVGAFMVCLADKYL